MCKVLIVDDDNNYLESVSDNLQRMQPSYQIEPVYSFSQAVELILQGNLYDYAIIDVRLGDNTNDEDRLGLGLAATLNELQPDVRVIMLSQYNVTKVFMKALRATNIINFIEKGGKESFDELVRTIEENRALPRIP
ncbi:MAG: response regulator, partial [Anaerolinea sp.]|nr:response regulator [Anaerolinea sp.]